MEVAEIAEVEVQTALKRMKKGRSLDINEVCADMLIAVGKIRVS